MKKTMILFTLLLLAGLAKTQTFGIKGGYSISRMMVRSGTSIYSADYKFTSGFNVAATLEFAQSNHFSLVTGIGLTTKGLKTEETEEYVSGGESAIYSQVYKMKIINAEVPLQAKVAFHIGTVKIYGALGPYGGLGLFGRQKAAYHSEYTYGGERYEEEESETEAVEFDKNGFHRLDYGGIGTIGFEFKGVTFETSYSHGVSNLIGDLSDSYKVQNRNFEISIGYKFGKN